ncbi:Purine nucleoside phosphorylase DeoD-type [bioreactor metagenome]|uniref:Purine nucleoside phosphorylase DeoD-type n=1 Tax=bioreactor metagenome TaxID=1076179 RepID=A0A645GFF8_9ZZZZ
MLAVSTGIGGASAGIAVEELSRLGVKNMIRIGSSGALQPEVKVGDLILKVDDTVVSSNSTLASIIANYNSGDQATLTIQRDGKEQTVSVTFGEYKPSEQ